MTTSIVSTSSTQSKIQIGGVDVITLDQTKGITGLPSAAAPAFSALGPVSQSIPAATPTKVQFGTEEFDTANSFDSSTNFRFTPLVAGYYQLNSSVRTITGTANQESSTYLYKNGVLFKILGNVFHSVFQRGAGGSALVYANGATDYFEIWCYSTGALTLTTESGTYFQGVLVRPA